MKEGRTIEELKAELVRQQEAKRDFDVPSTKLDFIKDCSAVDGGYAFHLAGKGDFPLTEHCHNQLAAKLNIPVAYYRRMAEKQPKLLIDNVSTWLRDEPKDLFLRTLYGRSRAVMSSGYKPMDAFPIAKTVIPALDKLGCKIESAEITESNFYLKAVCHSMQKKLAKVGDIIACGITVGTSEIGQGKFFLDPFSLRLKCLNGMTHNEWGSRHVHLGKAHTSDEAREWYKDTTLALDDATWLAKVKDTVEHFFSDSVFDQIIAKMDEAAATPLLARPQEVIEVAQKKYSWTEDESERVLEHYIRDNERNVWGLANAVTRTAQDLPDYDRASEFERQGGRIIELPRSDWRAIAEAA